MKVSLRLTNRPTILALVLLLVGIPVAIGPATAADAEGNFSIRGAGTVTCAAYLGATPEQRLHAESWWAGYLTAMNRATGDTYDLLGGRDVDEATALLEDHCRDHPDQLFALAVHAMLEHYYQTRTTRQP